MTNEVVEGLELETLLVTPSTSSSLMFFTPTSSLCRNDVGVAFTTSVAEQTVAWKVSFTVSTTGIVGPFNC
jgi:hypothetical protein